MRVDYLEYKGKKGKYVCLDTLQALMLHLERGRTGPHGAPSVIQKFLNLWQEAVVRGTPDAMEMMAKRMTRGYIGHLNPRKWVTLEASDQEGTLVSGGLALKPGLVYIRESDNPGQLGLHEVYPAEYFAPGERASWYPLD